MNTMRQDRESTPVQPGQDELALLHQCRQRDRAAFNRLMQQYADAIFTYLAQEVKDEPRAADLTRQVFVSAYKSIDRVHGDRAPKVWLLQLAEHHLRRAQWQQQSWRTRIVAALSFGRRSQIAPESVAEPQPAALCQAIRELLPAYYDVELPARDAQRVRQHLQQCAACQAEYDAWLKTVNLLETLDRKAAPRELRAQINAELDAITSFWHKLTGWCPLSSGQLTAMTTSVLMVCSIISYWQQREFLRQSASEPRNVRALASDPSTTQTERTKFVIVSGTAFPVEISPWLSEQIVTDASQTDLRQSNLPAETIITQLETHIRALQGVVRREPLTAPAGFTVVHLIADVPATAALSLANILNTFETPPAAPADIPTTRLDFYIISRN